MIPRLIRRAAASVPVAVVLGFVPSANAVVQTVSNCNGPVIEGVGIVTQDLDCTGTVNENIILDGSKLYLNGHTIVTGDHYVIRCNGSCKILGPGTITGNGSGVFGGKNVTVKDVTFSTAGLAAGAAFKLTLDNVSINGPGGAYGGRGARIVDSTITASSVGVKTGFASPNDESCSKGSLIIRRSTITGTTSADCDGTPGSLCADIVSCKRPRVSDSTCNTSCQWGLGAPCPTWGICTAD